MGRTAYLAPARDLTRVSFGAGGHSRPVEPQHEPTPAEEESVPGRLEEEEAQRYPGHEAPHETIDPGREKEEEV